MSVISSKDREILRTLANKQLALAHTKENQNILQKWNAQGEGRRDTPPVRFLTSNFPHEVIIPYMTCEGEEARDIEYSLLSTVSGKVLFDDDTPISDTFDVQLCVNMSVFGAKPHYTYSDQEHGKGYHIDPVIEALSDGLGEFLGGNFNIDLSATEKYEQLVQDVLGDILTVRRTMNSLTGSITNPIVSLMGMENYYCAMYDSPDELLAVMDMACSLYEAYYDYLEEHKLLCPTVGTSAVMQESFAFTNELPTSNVTKTTQCWGFLESQETTAVSPDTFGRFVFPFQDRLAKRFGLLSYGCCERVDAIFPEYISQWKHLRKLSVSPFNNEEQIGEYLRGSRIVYYSKPRAEHVTLPGPLDEEFITKYFAGIAKAASGCLLEVAQREAGTIFSDPQRGRRYVQLAKQAIESHWKP